MKRIVFILIFAMFCKACGLRQVPEADTNPTLWRIETLEANRQALQDGDPTIRQAYKGLLSKAEKLLTLDNPSVMTKPTAPVSGDMHDYMSLARYYWPNPASSDGLPYISRDGVSNPELNLYDRNRLGELASRVSTLALVACFSGDERFASKAVSMLDTWFLDPATCMNPHLTYAQVTRGSYGDKGRPAGILDGYSLIQVTDAAILLYRSGALSQDRFDRIREWFAKLAEWMQNDPNGIAESNMKNNHSIAYDVQLAVFCSFTGDTTTARKVIEAFPERRLAAQIAEDGSQPHELRRTRAFHYSVYNLAHIVDMCYVAESIGIDLYGQCAERIDLTFDFLLPHIGHPELFPYKQIDGWDKVEREFALELFRISRFSSSRERYRSAAREIFTETPPPLFLLTHRE